MAPVSETRSNIGNQQTQTIRVFIVDDSSIVQARLVILLRELTGVEIVGQAQTASTSIVDIRNLKPDVVILDIYLPDNNGLTVLKAIKQEQAAAIVVVLTNHVSSAYHHQCRLAGADYFLDKSTEFDQIPSILAGLRPGAAFGPALKA